MIVTATFVKRWKGKRPGDTIRVAQGVAETLAAVGVVKFERPRPRQEKPAAAIPAPATATAPRKTAKKRTAKKPATD